MNRFDWFKLTSSGILLPTLEPVKRFWSIGSLQPTYRMYPKGSTIPYISNVREVATKLYEHYKLVPNVKTIVEFERGLLRPGAAGFFFYKDSIEMELHMPDFHVRAEQILK